MGTWGFDTFDDDDARDWVYDLEERGVEAIDQALGEIVEIDDYIDTDVGSRALAACEVVAALAEKPSEGLTDEVLAWVESQAEIDVTRFRDTALSAIDYILGDRSELKDRWADSDGFEPWKARVLDLQSRLATIR